MKDKSTMECGEFLGSLAWGVFFGMIWYRSVLFRCLPGMTYTQSKIILWVLLIGYAGMGAALFFRYRRTGWTAMVCVLLPFGIFTAAAYGKTVPSMLRAALTLALLLSMMQLTFRITGKMSRKARKHKARVYANRLYGCFCFTQFAFAAALTAVMVFLGSHRIFGTTITNSRVMPVSGDAASEWTIAGNLKDLALLREEEWKNLSVQERLDVLQIVANIEARYLGLPNELNVGTANLEGDTLGSYLDDTHTIHIALPHIENDTAHSVLDTLCHEAYHSLEYRFVDEYRKADETSRGLLFYRRAAHYAEEFEDYKDGNENFCGYYSQYCEADCRDYAEAAVDDYYEKITAYLLGDEKTSE